MERFCVTVTETWWLDAESDSDAIARVQDYREGSTADTIQFDVERVPVKVVG